MARVLIADSSPDVAQLLAVALGRHGHEVALHVRGTVPPLLPDVLIVDAELHDAAGIAAEQRSRRPGLTVLATGIRSLEGAPPPLGACRYLAKPFRLAEIVEVVASVPTGFLPSSAPRSYAVDRSS